MLMKPIIYVIIVWLCSIEIMDDNGDLGEALARNKKEKRKNGWKHLNCSMFDYGKSTLVQWSIILYNNETIQPKNAIDHIQLIPLIKLYYSFQS